MTLFKSSRYRLSSARISTTASCSRGHDPTLGKGLSVCAFLVVCVAEASVLDAVAVEKRGSGMADKQKDGSLIPASLVSGQV